MLLVWSRLIFFCIFGNIYEGMYVYGMYLSFINGVEVVLVENKELNQMQSQLIQS